MKKEDAFATSVSITIRARVRHACHVENEGPFPRTEQPLV